MTPVLPALTLKVLSLRYSSWSMRPWLVLTQAGADFDTETVSLPSMLDPTKTTSLSERRQLGSVRGLFPVLQVGQDGDNHKNDDEKHDTLIHESLAICEYVAELFPNAHLWPTEPLDRAQARAICCEMTTGFMELRKECACHLFARVPAFAPAAETLLDIERVFEIWTACLERSGGPYLFGEHFGIADAMYFPVLTRFRTYGIELPTELLKAYAATVEATPAVRKLMALAATEPAIPIYDDYVRKLGGDPDKEL